MSASPSSKVLMLTVLSAGLAAGCGGKSSSYPPPVTGTGGSAAGSGGAIGSGGSGTGTGGMGTSSGGATATGGAIAPGEPVPIAAFGTERLAASCARQAKCGIVPDLASCLATTWVDTVSLTLQADVAAGRVTYDPAIAAKCLAALRDGPCTASTIAANAAAPNPCEGITKGTVAVGQTCFLSDECSGGNSCFSATDCTMACCAGTCVAPLPAGGNCATAPCVSGTYCRQTGQTTFRCTPQATAEGAACDSGDACVPPLFCVADEGGTSGSCVKTLPATGAACNVNSGCNDAFRDYCAANVCTKMLAVGQPCTPGTETTPDPCVWYAYCNGGVCKAAGGPGAVCMTAANGADDCLGAQVCSTGKTCAPPPAASSCQ